MLQQWERTVGAECPRHHAGKQKGIAIFFKVFHILDVQVTRVAWAPLCSASALLWVPGSCWGCRALLADMCQGLSICGQEPSPSFTLRVFLCSFLSVEAAVHVQRARSRPDLGPRGQILPPPLTMQGHRPHEPWERRGQWPWPDPHGPKGISLVHPSVCVGWWE